MLTPDSGARRNVYRQVSRVKNVPPQGLPQIQPVVVPEVGAESPAVLPEEVREA